MQKIIFRYGLMAGLIVAAWMVGAIALCYTLDNFEGNMLLGYASMLLAFSFIYVAVKKYRDQQNSGIISFGKAFSVGLLITSVASTLYVAVWLVDYYVFIPDFLEKYTAHVLQVAQAQGASSTELAAKAKEMDQYKEMYKNPLLVILLTYTEILPVGLLVSLFSALLLKRKTYTGSLAAAG
jgi:hypothetical protein